MPRENTSPLHHRLAQKPYFNKNRAQAKTFKRPNDGHPKHDVLLHRPSSPPSGTLLKRIGGPVEDDEAASTLSASDGGVSEDLPFSTTPDPTKAERFLQSVIGTLPVPSSPSGTTHTFSGHDPSLALEPPNLSADHPPVKVEDPSCSVPLSPTQTVNSLPSFLTLGQSPLMDDHTPSPSTIEQCKKLLVPVILASVQSREPRARLDSEQCLRLLSDDHCIALIRKAKKMRRQLSSVLSQETPIYQERSGSLKRDRAHEVGAWVRNTRTRFDSANTVVSDVSRRDSDITLVDVTMGSRSPPKAPRAMLQASQLKYGSARDGAPYRTASPTIEGSPASLLDLVHKVIRIFPTLKLTSQAMAETVMTDVSEGQLTAPPPAQMSSSVPLTSADFVSHLPTEPGTWFRQQGKQYAEIVDVDVEVSRDMFYLSREREPSRVRTPLRLCSIPVGTGEAPVALSDVITERHTFQWPKKGKLVIQVNPESERHKTWLPNTLESDPLDVTACIQPGKNVFRFIQLSDLSGFVFVLVASPPPPEEAWRGWDWASLADSRTRSPSVDDPTDNLSELARIQQGIQVTIRS